MAKASLPVPFRVDGPPLSYEFDDPPLIRPDGTYADEEPWLKRKRVDGDDDDEMARIKRLSAGAKGNARNVIFSSDRLRVNPCRSKGRHTQLQSFRGAGIRAMNSDGLLVFVSRGHIATVLTAVERMLRNSRAERGLPSGGFL